MSEDNSLLLFREALDASPVPTVILERRGAAINVIYVNAAFERRSGYAAATILDKGWRILCGRESGRMALPELRFDSNDDVETVFHGVRHDGSVFWSELMLAPLGNAGAASRYLLMLHDVTAERAERERLRHFALHDELTGLPNRRALDQRLVLAIGRARAEQRAFPLLLLDLDGFKPVNDTFGHDVGDHLLRVVGSRLQNEVRAGDTVARVGGDEFVLLLESVREASQLEDIRERLWSRVTAPVAVDATTINVGCSIGASWFPLDGADWRSLSQHADRRMYAEKRRRQLTRDGFFAAARAALPIQQLLS